MSLTPSQRDELVFVCDAEPRSIHEYDREPERWLRMVVRKATVEALRKAGLCGQPYHDYPMGGWRAELTDEGLRVRRELRSGVKA